MADGSLLFDTAIDEQGFQRGLRNIGQSVSRAAGEAAREAGQAADEAEDAVAQAADGATDAAGRAAQAARQAADDTRRSVEDAGREAAAAAERAAGEIGDSSREAGNGAEAAAARVEDGIEALATVLSAAGIAVAVQEIAGALYDCTQAAAAFETGVAKVMTIADGSKASMDSMKKEIMELSSSIGVDANEISESTYQAISASVDTASAVGVVGEASKLAIGGFTDTATAIDILTTAMNAYGMGTDQVARLSDVLVTTQNLGKTSVGEVASAMGKVIPLAAAYGMEIENLSSAYAVLTANGIKTDEATTYMKAALNELGDTGSKVGKILVKKTGKGFAQLTDEGKSLGDVLEIIGDSVDGDAVAFNNLWSSSEAGVGMLSIYNSGVQKFNSVLGQMQGSAGATESAFRKMTDTAEYAKKSLGNAMENMKIAIGDKLTPALKGMYEAGTDAFTWAAKLVDDHPEILAAVTGLTAALAAMAAGVAGVKALRVAIDLLSGSLAANPWVLLASAVVGVTAALATLASVTGDVESESARMQAQARRLSEEAAELKESVSQTAQAMDEASDSTCAQYAVYEDMTAAAYELNDAIASGSVADEDAAAKKAQLAYYVRQLNDAFPELNMELDEQTGLIKQGREEIDGYIRALKTKALFEVASDGLSQLYKDEAKASIDAGKAAEEYAAAEQAKKNVMEHAQRELAAYQDMQSLYNSGMYDGVEYMENDYASALAKIAQAHGVTKEQMAGGVDAMERATVECVGYEAAMEDAKKAQDDASEAQAAASKEIDATSKAIAKQMAQAGYSREEIAKLTGVVLKEGEAESKASEASEEYAKTAEDVEASAEVKRMALESLREKYEEVKASLEQDMDKKISLFKAFDGGDQYNLDDAAGRLQEQRDALLKWKENMETLAGEIGGAMTAEMYDELLKLGPDYANFVQQLADCLNPEKGGSKEQLEQLAREWAETQEAKREIAEGVGATQMMVQNMVDQMAGANELDFSNLEKAFHEAANAAKTGGKEIPQALQDGFAETLQVARSMGVAIPGGLAEGLASGEISVADAIGQLKGGIEAQFAFLSEMAQNAGVTIPDSIKQGIAEGGDEAVNAVERLQELLLGEQEKAGKEYGQAGKENAEAIGDGTEAAKQQVVGAVGNVVQQAAGAASSQEYKFRETGWHLMDGLAAGIVAHMPAVEEAAREAVRSAVDGAKDEGKVASPSKVFEREVGVWIARGMAEGIEDGTGEVQESARGMAHASLDAAKEELDIHSPSGVFDREVGRQIVEGVREGILGQKKKLLKEMKRLAQDASDTMQKAAADGSYTQTGSSIVDAFAQSLQKRQEMMVRKAQAAVDKYVEKAAKGGKVKTYEKQAKDMEKAAKAANKSAANEGGSKADRDAAKKEAKRFEEQAKKLRDKAQKLQKKYQKEFQMFGDGFSSALSEGIESAFDELFRNLEERVSDISGKYQKMCDKLADQRESMYEKLAVPVNFYNLDSQLAQVRRYQDGLKGLKGRIPDTLMDEVLGMGMNEAVDFSEYLNGMTAEELAAYTKKWEELAKGAQAYSDSFFEAQFAQVKGAYEKEIDGVLKDAAKKSRSIGKNICQGLVEGLQSEKDVFSKECKKMADLMISRFKKAFKIQSPSRVMRDEVGKFLPPGIAEGFAVALPDAERRITDGLAQAMNSLQGRVEAMQYVPAAPYAEGAYLPQIRLASSQQVQVQAEIHTTVDLDGRTVGRAVTPYVNRNLGGVQVREERGS